MGIPFGNETVTLVQRTETQVNGKTQAAYTTSTLTGCSWRRTRRAIRVENALVYEEAVTCRIPAGQAKPAPGDLMIRGSAEVTVTGWAEYQSLIEANKGTDGAFVVSSVRDNARPGMPLPHYAATGV